MIADPLTLEIAQRSPDNIDIKAASAAAVTSLSQLLVHREVVHGGLGIHTLFAVPILAVAFEAMPTAFSKSQDYKPSDHMALLGALRALTHISRSVPGVNLAILGVQHAALREGFDMPVEAVEYFRLAAAFSAADRSRNGVKQTSSDWVVDLPRSTTDLENARLDSLMVEIEKLMINGKEKEG